MRYKLLKKYIEKGIRKSTKRKKKLEAMTTFLYKLKLRKLAKECRNKSRNIRKKGRRIHHIIQGKFHKQKKLNTLGIRERSSLKS